MSLKSWLRNCWNGGPGRDWAGNKLNSRKWLALNVACLVTVAICYYFVARLGITSSSIIEKALDTIQVVTVGYYGTNVLEKFLLRGGNQ